MGVEVFLRGYGRRPVRIDEAVSLAWSTLAPLPRGRKGVREDCLVFLAGGPGSKAVAQFRVSALDGFVWYAPDPEAPLLRARVNALLDRLSAREAPEV